MKIVIDISEDVYTRLFDNGIQDNEIAVDDVCEMARAIRLGTPLPKGHGDLKDADAICKDIISVLGIRDENYLLEAEEAVYKRIKNAPTIIEADKEESEVQENDIPWYLKIFNQDILNEYQKRMRDATPEESEIPYNDKGSSIHSEVYKEETNEDDYISRSKIIELIKINRNIEYEKSIRAEVQHKSVIRSKHDAHVAFCDYLINEINKL